MTSEEPQPDNGSVSRVLSRINWQWIRHALPFVVAFAIFATLGISIATYLESDPSTKPMRYLIEMEAQAALSGDVEAAVDLYAEDAIIRDALGELEESRKPTGRNVRWQGTKEIRERYEALPKFNSLAHIGIIPHIEPGDDFGEASASTTGIIDRGSTTEVISSIQGELWTFAKIDGTWKITTFTYNLPRTESRLP